MVLAQQVQVPVQRVQEAPAEMELVVPAEGELVVPTEMELVARAEVQLVVPAEQEALQVLQPRSHHRWGKQQVLEQSTLRRQGILPYLAHWLPNDCLAVLLY